jgi:hypothetical protein
VGQEHAGGWLARDAVTAGWVSLDSGDNDPKRFWRYLLLAADQTGSAAGTAALRRLDAAGSDVLPSHASWTTSSADCGLATNDLASRSTVAS